MTRSLGHMNTPLFEKILEEATYFTDPCWFHWFGEPLMNPRLFEQIAVASQGSQPRHFHQRHFARRQQ